MRESGGKSDRYTNTFKVGKTCTRKREVLEIDRVVDHLSRRQIQPEHGGKNCALETKVSIL